MLIKPRIYITYDTEYFPKDIQEKAGYIFGVWFYDNRNTTDEGKDEAVELLPFRCTVANEYFGLSSEDLHEVIEAWDTDKRESSYALKSELEERRIIVLPDCEYDGDYDETFNELFTKYNNDDDVSDMVQELCIKLAKEEDCKWKR